MLEPGRGNHKAPSKIFFYIWPCSLDQLIIIPGVPVSQSLKVPKNEHKKVVPTSHSTSLVEARTNALSSFDNILEYSSCELQTYQEVNGRKVSC